MRKLVYAQKFNKSILVTYHDAQISYESNKTRDEKHAMRCMCVWTSDQAWVCVCMCMSSLAMCVHVHGKPTYVCENMSHARNLS